MMVTSKELLSVKCEPCSSVEEGEKIGAQLLKYLTESPTGIGLAANQLGINKRVCVINCKDPVVLINPEIIEKSEEMFAFGEGCLSFPDDYVRTQRHKWVKVKTDNHEEILYFSVWHISPGEEGYDKEKYLDYAYETACVQHEIDHLDGFTMHDREWKPQPRRRAYRKIGRNEKVLIKKGEETKTIKFKKYDKMQEDGWVLVEV